MADLPLDLFRIVGVGCDDATLVSLCHASKALTICFPLVQERQIVKDEFCAACSLDGYLELLKWGRENGCTWDTYTCSNACKNGHMDVLLWVRENGCPWDQQSVLVAGIGGHQEIFEHLIQNKCDFPKNFVYEVSVAGHVEILKYCKLRLRNLFVEEECLRGACLGKKKSVAEFIQQTTVSDRTVSMVDALFGDLEKHKNNIAMFPEEFFGLAALACRMDILEFAEKNLPEQRWLTQDLYQMSFLTPNLEIFGWVLKNYSAIPNYEYPQQPIPPKNLEFFLSHYKIPLWMISLIAKEKTPETIKMLGKKILGEVSANSDILTNLSKWAVKASGPEGSLGAIKILKWVLKKFKNLKSSPEDFSVDFSLLLRESASRPDLKVFRWILKNLIPDKRILTVLYRSYNFQESMMRDLSLEKYLWLQKNTSNPEISKRLARESATFRSLQVAEFFVDSGDSTWCLLSSEPFEDPRVEELARKQREGK